MLRIAGLALLAVSAAALWADWADRADGGLRTASIAERWAELHTTSLIGLQSGLENRVHPDLFFDWVLPVLETPAAPVFAVAGALLLGLARLRRG